MSSANRGGGGKYLPNAVGATTDPLRSRDLMLAQMAYRRMLRSIQAQMINQKHVSPQNHSIFRMTKDILSRLVCSSPTQCLTARQRAFCLKFSGLETLPPMPAIAPLHLPKKPPGRLQEPAETMYAERKPT